MTPHTRVAEPAVHSLSADERAAILEAVRDFAQAEIAPHALEWDAAQHFPRDVLERGGELGLGGLNIREDVGGTGLSRSDSVAIVEELAMADPSVAAYVTIHNMVAWMIDTYGTEAQRQEWLPRLVSMSDFGAYCLTEPGAGSDAAAIATSAIRSGDDYVLTGVKQFISGAGAASVYVVMARTGPMSVIRRRTIPPSVSKPTRSSFMLSIATRDLFWTTKFRRQRLSALSMLLSSTSTFSSAAKAQSGRSTCRTTNARSTPRMGDLRGCLCPQGGFIDRICGSCPSSERPHDQERDSYTGHRG